MTPSPGPSLPEERGQASGDNPQPRTLPEAIEYDEKHGTYRPLRLRCTNCRWEDSGVGWGLPIPKGQLVQETDCPRCECKTLVRGL